MRQNNSYQDLFTEVNNVIISYHDVGEGSIPVIFLHGYPFDKSMWMRQLDDLKASNRVISYDIRGFGKSKDELSTLSIDQFTDDLMSFMDKLNIEKSIICGLSMGGYIALNATARFPERFRALILCDTQCISDTTEVKESRIAAIEQIKLNGPTVFNEKFIKSVFHPNSLKNKTELVQNIENIVFANSKEIIIAGLSALADRSETCSNLNKILLPTLIICGREDKVTPMLQSEFMHEQIKGSLLKIIEDAGHLSNLEQPVDFNKHLQDFLNTLNAAIFTEIPFEVDCDGIYLTVQSLDTVDFAVFKGTQSFAIITPERIGSKLTWTSKDISTEYAQQIGELVALHENL